MSRITYRYNGVDLSTLGVVVKSSSGVLERPELKERKTFDWDGEDGEVVDLDVLPHYQPRHITLDCTMYADNAKQFIERIQSLERTLTHTGCKVLTIDVPGCTTLAYLVYLEKSIVVSKQWRASGAMCGNFTLSLCQPTPCVTVATMDFYSDTIYPTASLDKGDVIEVSTDSFTATFTATESANKEWSVNLGRYLDADTRIFIKMPQGKIITNLMYASIAWNSL